METLNLKTTEDIRARLAIAEKMVEEWDKAEGKYKEPYTILICILLDQIRTLLSKDLGFVKVIDKRDVIKEWEEEVEKRGIIFKK